MIKIRVEIGFTEQAIELCTFTDYNLRLFIKDDDGSIIKVMPYNSHTYEKVKAMNVPIINRIQRDVLECETIPKKVLLLGRLKYGP